MRHQNVKMAMVLMISALVLLSPIVRADTDTDVQAAMAAVQTVLSVVDTLQRIVDILSEAKEPLFRALSFASGGLHSYSPSNGRQNAQAIVNLLEGVDSEYYDPIIDVSVDFPIGIRPHMAGLLSIDQEWAATRGNTWTEDSASSWQNILSMLRMSSTAMLSVLEGDLSGQEISDAFLIATTFIWQTYDGINTMLKDWGYEIWVAPGESIQAAIDTANEGATIYLEPGTYRETLEITKSITLEGWMAELPQTPNGVRRGYGTVLQPVGDQAGILIHSSEPIAVEIRRLSIEEASNGITVSGSAQLLLEDSDILKCSVGIETSETASVEMIDCHLEYNDIAVLLGGTSVSEIRDCGLRYCDNLLGALQIIESSFAIVSGSLIGDNAGNGIFVFDQAQLAIEDSYLLMNGGDGVLLAGNCQVEMNGTSISWNGEFGLRTLTEECASEELEYLEAFTGAIDGSGNFIAAQGTVGGNDAAAVCPESLLFLTEPKPEEE